jgi:uncharacterized protein YceH (UPF0502 family)
LTSFFTMSTASPERTWVPLTARERRVAGVLVEKQKTTPDNYPMTVNGLVTGCNQKSNRDPITNYDADDIEETLHSLRKKGAAVLYEGLGRVEKWKHTLYDWLDLKNHSVEMAVLAELLLRGPQTEGELRARASRMLKQGEQLDLAALQQVLEFLAARELVIYLSPPGQRRGVVITHNLYPAEDLERVRQEFARSPLARDDEPAASPRAAGPSGLAAELETLRGEVQSLREQLAALSAEVRDLKTSLGI